MTAKVTIGSSPRIRGEWHVPGADFEGVGIIPANTGRIGHRIADDNERQDHPREYGENSLRQAANEGIQGSSPRIRGECTVKIEVKDHVGIIPANTGRIAPTYSPMVSTRDHPREYGENSPPTLQARRTQGSSPRIRGE